MNNKIKIGITQGDINGVGSEVIIKALADTQMLDFCIPVIYGSAKVLSFYRKNLATHSFNPLIINNIKELNAKRVNIINCIEEDLKVEFGQATEEAGRAAFLSLERATQDLKNGQIDVLVTAPINKNTIPADKNFVGHCQFFENAFDEKGEALPFLINDLVRIAPAAALPQDLSKELIVAKLRKLKQSLVQDFSINLPRIAVLALNKTAGAEEENIIIPAIKEAETEDIICVGTYEMDDFFDSRKFEQFDAVLAMSDEQGLTAFKRVSLDGDVCYTAGLSAIRTAPLHGVEYENAGKNQTSEEAFRNALYVAIDIFRNRKFYKEITANPLPVKKKRYANG
ncbi:MAG: 4-hydroxythreonine-4-phosphate dehydrogenase PdxA [Prevotellaceae bacterium]|jgi:4-hydroxythreonine-4-phosphate dehydrogenase|nr:4-hydroxythreonine-4-phosphate dehydrogenase PdxA [Prevotellaceae bacterium]